MNTTLPKCSMNDVLSDSFVSFLIFTNAMEFR